MFYRRTRDEKKAASQGDSKASVNIATVKQKKRALNRMYYHIHKQKMCLKKREKYATNSDDKKVISRAYSKASYSINPQKNHALSVMRVSCILESNCRICKVVYI